MILTNDVSVNGQDDAWYLTNANGMSVTEAELTGTVLFILLRKIVPIRLIWG